MSDAPLVPPPPPTRSGSPAGVVRSAKRIAVITLASRVCGMVRDIALAAWLGNDMVQDRFTYGFIISNVFRRLFGEGALAAAFVPTLSRALQQEGPREGRRLFSAVATLLAVVLAAITLVGEAVLLVLLMLGSGESYRLGVGLTAAMLPFMPLICVTALMASCLNVLGRFSWPAAMPILMNLIQVACIWWIAPNLPGGPSRQVYAVAAAVVVSGLAQVLVLGFQLRRLGYPWRWLWLPSHPGVRTVMLTMAPAMIGMGILQIEPLIDGQIILWLSAAGPHQTVELAGRTYDCPLDEGSQSSVSQAQRLYQFPLGVLAISLATAVFPALARHAAAGDHAAMRAEVGRSVRLAIFEGLPAGVGLILLAEPITRLLFEHGRFTPANTAATAWVLRFYAAGLWAFCAQHMLLRGFYAMHDTRTPLKVSVAAAVSHIPLNLVLVWTPLGAGSFGLTASATAAASVFVLAWLLRSRLGGRLDLVAILGGFLRAATASAAMALVVWAALRLGEPHWTSAAGSLSDLLAGRLPVRLLRNGLEVLVPMAAGGAVFLAVSAALGSAELRELLDRRRTRRTATTRKD